MSRYPLKTDFTFSTPLRVRYAEVDPQSIVFNANYLTYFNVGVTEYFRSFGGSYESFMKESSMDFHVNHATVHYVSPARFDDELDICVSGEYHGPKIFWKLAVFRAEEFLCTGELIYVAVNPDTGRVQRIPKNVAETIGLKPRITT